MRKNLALFTVAVILYLFFGELAMRVWFQDITTTYDNRSYFALQWKASSVHVNSAAYREREFDRTKPAGVYRIAFIGDSFTFGQGIREEERMSNLLERELTKSRHDIEVLNFGNPGSNTAYEVTVLRDEVLPKVAPDFVLLQWYVNDLDYIPPPADTARGDAKTTGGDLLNEFKQTMLNRSVLYFLLTDVFHRVRDSMGVSHIDEMSSHVGNPQSMESQEAEKAMVEFFRLCQAKMVPVGVVLVPHLGPLGGREYPFMYLHKRLLTLCEREGVPCVDLFPVMEPFLQHGENASKLWVNRFDLHMGPFANELAAKRILEVFGPNWTMASSRIPGVHTGQTGSQAATN